jgi:hypothetical protein
MSFFTTLFVQQLEDIQKERFCENFCELWKDEIEDELDYLEKYVNENKDEIQEALLISTSFTNTTEASVLDTRSYNFSNVGSGNAVYHDHFEFTSYYDYILSRHPMYGRIQPYIKSEKTGLVTSMYRIWKSKGFLMKLAERLKLPKNAYFVVRSKKEDNTDFLTFPDEPIPQFTNTLILVYRFAK